MISLFRYRDSWRWPHLRDEVLIWVLEEEPRSVRAHLAKRHLRTCSLCQERQLQIDRTAGKVIANLQGLLQKQPPPYDSRPAFIERLDLLLQSLPATPWWKQLSWESRVRPFGGVAPSFASVAFLVGAGLILLSIWHWKLPTVSASEFLNRAVASENSSKKALEGKVVRRRIRIKTARKTFDRAIYRDDSGFLHTKGVKVAADELDLAAHLAAAGVNWEDPLSAATFKSWHDRQSGSTDEIYSTGKDLLTISTRVPNANIVEESLTVVEDNFRPVEKAIEYRDIGEVSISDVGSESVESEDAGNLVSESRRDRPISSHAPPTSPVMPTPSQLDETELQARLVLSEQSADTGEQIEIARNVKGVQVKGLVDSMDREDRLQESLRGIPFLTVAIRNVADFKSNSLSSAQSTIATESAVAQVSPLEKYFTDQGRSRDDLSKISSGLFNSALEINRSSRAIDEMLLRFCNNSGLSPAAIHYRDALLARNTARLLVALDEQNRFQAEAGASFDLKSIVPSPFGTATARFTELSERNTIAARELISGDSEPSRPSIQSIAAELSGTAAQLRAAAHDLHPGCAFPDQTGKPWE
jgi:hypothetical protein